jgi:hypothetical protein
MSITMLVVLAALTPDPAGDSQEAPPPLEETPVVVEQPKHEPARTVMEEVDRISERREKPKRRDEWGEGATFFGGVRTALAFPPGGDGPAPMGGIELGVAAEKGVGFGLHMFGAMNTPGAPTFDIPKTPYGFGAEADLRYYLQSIEPLRLYPTLSLGFMAGPAADTGKNVILPLINPGFGARVNFGSVYVALELGAASFYIPFMSFSVGWEPDREPI